jgi:hypothetical protein
MTQLIRAGILMQVNEPIEKYFCTSVSIFFSAYYRKEELYLAGYFFPSLKLRYTIQ